MLFGSFSFLSLIIRSCFIFGVNWRHGDGSFVIWEQDLPLLAHRNSVMAWRPPVVWLTDDPPSHQSMSNMLQGPRVMDNSNDWFSYFEMFLCWNSVVTKFLLCYELSSMSNSAFGCREASPMLCGRMHVKFQGDTYTAWQKHKQARSNVYTWSAC